jgi:hypothetical protein
MFEGFLKILKTFYVEILNIFILQFFKIFGNLKEKVVSSPLPPPTVRGGGVGVAFLTLSREFGYFYATRIGGNWYLHTHNRMPKFAFNFKIYSFSKFCELFERLAKNEKF